MFSLFQKRTGPAEEHAGHGGGGGCCGGHQHGGDSDPAEPRTKTGAPSAEREPPSEGARAGHHTHA